MTENSNSFDFTELSLGELESRSRTIVDQIRSYPGGVDACPLELLHENAAILQAMRRRSKNSGPPKSKSAGAAKAHATDLLSDI